MHTYIYIYIYTHKVCKMIEISRAVLKEVIPTEVWNELESMALARKQVIFVCDRTNKRHHHHHLHTYNPPPFPSSHAHSPRTHTHPYPVLP